MVYLFVGQDLPSKDAALERLKEEFLPKSIQELNLDILYGQELLLKELQEKIINLPAGPSKRILVIRNSQHLKKEICDFIVGWAKKEDKRILLVLDMHSSGKGELLSAFKGKAKILRFKEEIPLSSFDLARQIEKGQVALALKTLNNLLKDSGKPEMILGGLRYSFENQRSMPAILRKRISLILNCDIEIKTGKLKPVFALEKLVVSLSALR